MGFPGVLVTTVAATLAIGPGAAAQSAAVGAGAQNSAQVNAITDRYLTAVQAELTGKVDTKKAVVGQEVTAKTKDTAKLADGTTLPKGTKLVGRVMQVRAGGREEGMAMLALTFDRAELEGGQSVPVRSVIRTVAPAANAHETENAFAEPMAPMSNPAGAGPSGRTVTPGDAGVGGGGSAGAAWPSMGGTRGAATVPPVDSPINSPIDNPIDGTMGGTATSGGEGASPIGYPGGRTIGGGAADTRSLGGTASANRPVVEAGERTSPATRATALPGVMLSNTAVANASGTLTAFGRNISLESGTQITLGVITR